MQISEVVAERFLREARVLAEKWLEGKYLEPRLPREPPTVDEGSPWCTRAASSIAISSPPTSF